MATLFRPTWTAWFLAGVRCKAGTPGAACKRGRSKNYHGRYTDEHGTERQVRLGAHRATALAQLRELQRNADLCRRGIGDPYAAHKRRPLTGHLADYEAGLLARGRTPAHCRRTAQRVRDVLAAGKLEYTDQLTGNAVEVAVARIRALRDADPELPPPGDPRGYRLRELAGLLGCHAHSVSRSARRAGVHCGGRGKAARYSAAAALAIRAIMPGFGVATSNHYLGAVKAFCRWLVAERRMAQDPLSHLRPQNAQGDVRRRRRALPPEAFGRFVAATAEGRTFRGVSGADRLVIYTLAANTGLRAGELASLTPESFSLPPEGRGGANVTVLAVYSKRKREDVLPLRPDVAELMRAYLAAVPAGRRVWPGGWSKCGADMVRIDLEAAGIPFSEGGRVFDLHSVRGQFVTTLAAAGVHPRVVQELARHSDIRLTMRAYVDPQLLDIRGALDKLPMLPAKPDKDLG